MVYHCFGTCIIYVSLMSSTGESCDWHKISLNLLTNYQTLGSYPPTPTNDQNAMRIVMMYLPYLL